MTCHVTFRYLISWSALVQSCNQNNYRRLHGSVYCA